MVTQFTVGIRRTAMVRQTTLAYRYIELPSHQHQMYLPYVARNTFTTTPVTDKDRGNDRLTQCQCQPDVTRISKGNCICTYCHQLMFPSVG